MSKYGIMTDEIEVTDDNFNEKVIEKSKEVPIVVDFWAPWCGPCLMLSPVLKKAVESAEVKSELILVKANTNECNTIASAYGVRSIPNVKIFKNGEVISEMIGFRHLKEVKEWLEDSL